ncbi:YhgE/Pip domain-containing protein [Salipaludibacillus agaradhaerens]|uniref:YhgE/Pip domain-containing protein n=1 Tax=Salipaludibacillus agaradhaerens TaxID=76935 RepID=A0A9Q4B193_SALAG|nr:YhgE/Pip domain-containing protein [Salipaludibacillus agaradhaerens]MCR6096326.1 YhgE/Pip domain-containing protein [Salipaludibacillus agaradhaerens]MCR6114115.1 YhgE/Pip domain-containing protein [Salipaludibacillus agaradhaerens]
MMDGLKTEFNGIFKNKKLLIALIGICLMPLLYGGVLIWSFWDPYGHIEELPVAVVNKDQGAEINGEMIYAGNDFVEELKRTETLKFNFTDEETARAGMDELEYYFYVEIPEDFSENVTSIIEDKPIKATLYYEVNAEYNYVSSQIAKTALTNMETSLSEALTLAYAEVGNDTFSDFVHVMLDIEEGAEKVARGNENVYTNMSSLSDGLQELDNGAELLTAGLLEAQNGTSYLYSSLMDARETITSSEEYEQAIQGHTQLLSLVQQAKRTMDSKDFKEATKVLNDINTILYETHLSLEKLNNYSQSVEKNIKVVSDMVIELNQGTESLLEELEQLAAKLDEQTSLEELNIDDIDEQINGVLNELSTFEGEGELENQLASLPHMLDNLDENWEENESLVRWVNETEDLMEDQSTSQQELTEYLETFQANLPDYGETVETNLATASLDIVDYIDILETSLATSDEIEQGIKEDLDLLNEAMTDFQEMIDHFQETVPEAIDPQLVEKFEDDIYEALNNAETKLIGVSDEYKTAVGKLDDLFQGVRELDDGMSALYEGSGELHEGIESALEGALKLTDGTYELKEGSGDLLEGIHQLASVIHGINPTHAHELMVSSPVETVANDNNTSYSYGEGLTPYFLSIGLYVGALTLSIIYPFREPLGVHTTSSAWFTGKLSVIYSIGFIQSSLIVLFLLLGIGLDVQNIPGFVFFTYFTSFVFITLIFGLVSLLDNPGRFVAIILLILQLGGSAGTFPVELLASPLQTLHGWLPMTYSVLGFRSMIFMNSPQLLWSSVLFLLIVPVVLLSVTFYFFKRNYSLYNTLSIEDKAS